jgi:hypothetical protein
MRGVVRIKSNGDAAENVVAASWQPCRADEGTRMESSWIVVEVVDYAVDEFWWENARRHGRKWNPEAGPVSTDWSEIATSVWQGYIEYTTGHHLAVVTSLVTPA